MVICLSAGILETRKKKTGARNGRRSDGDGQVVMYRREGISFASEDEERERERDGNPGKGERGERSIEPST